MARSKRRRRHSPSKANPRSYSELRTNGVQEAAPTPAAPSQIEPKESERPARSAPSQGGKVKADWTTEYSRVFSDLKQLLIVSVALFAVMLVVGLFL